MMAKFAPATHFPLVLSSASLPRSSLPSTSTNRQCCVLRPVPVNLAASNISSFISGGTTRVSKFLTSNFVLIHSKVSIYLQFSIIDLYKFVRFVQTPFFHFLCYLYPYYQKNVK